MRSYVILVILFVLLCSGIVFGAGGTMSGSGTQADPYLIEDFDDFQAFCDDEYKWGRNDYTRLECDLDLAQAGIYIQAPIAGYQNVYPYKVKEYGGVFDGNGHVISNLTVNGVKYCGLFGYLRSGSLVMNLGLENILIICSGDYAGSIAGECRGDILNCYSTGSITGDDYIGGLAGKCVGASDVTNCYSSTSVEGGFYTGGLVGYIDSATVEKCYVYGTVTGQQANGGLVGGRFSGQINYCFWDVETSGLESSAGGMGLTTAQMQNSLYFAANNWAGDDWGISEGEYPRLAWENVGGTLITDPVMELAGAGTLEEPYLINSLEDFLYICAGPFFWDKNYALNTDVDLSEQTFTSGVLGYDYNNSFTGSFNGNGHVIRNLDIEGANYCALFGHLGLGASVANLGLENVSINSTGDFVGSVAGSNGGSILECYSTGAISGKRYVGGLVGNSSGESEITYCYSACSVAGDSMVGGLAGFSDSDMINCFSGTLNSSGYRHKNTGVLSGSILQISSVPLVDSPAKSQPALRKLLMSFILKVDSPVPPSLSLCPDASTSQKLSMTRASFSPTNPPTCHSPSTSPAE